MFNEFQLISGLLHEEMCLLSCVADLYDLDSLDDFDDLDDINDLDELG